MEVMSNPSEGHNLANFEVKSCLLLVFEHLLGVMAELIDRRNKDHERDKSDIFSSSSIPKIPLKNYLERISKMCEVENSTLILALIYLNRFQKATSQRITKFNAHRLLLISIVVSVKINEDYIMKDSCYAAIGGIKIELLATLERAFLDSLEWDLYVDDETYQAYSLHLLKL